MCHTGAKSIILVFLIGGFQSSWSITECNDFKYLEAECLSCLYKTTHLSGIIDRAIQLCYTLLLKGNMT
jgi:hypothetical protein